MVETQDLQASRLFSVEGWVCLITGGGTGIGLMCAQALAANGARVYITGRRFDVLQIATKVHSPKSGPGKITPLGPCDVTSKDSLASLVTSLSALESRLDLLVCSAGISGPKASPSSTSASTLAHTLWEAESPSAWSDVFNTNVTAVYFTTLAFLSLLQAASTQSGHMSGNVIVISSMSGIIRHSQGHFAYNAAKGATVHLTKLMSTEFQKTGVRVNSIAPGYFPSEMTTGGSDERGKSELSDEKVRGKGHPVPAGRAGSDEEMAMACLFLARNRYVNGEVVVVDGGVRGQVPG
ncbi:short chain dehydrogenase/ reductase [Podospora aff. communis PSN243]|uniref:Short chain dehydrogenase/ reductase n=1 Tax=Podospora aff. communis PSN243 TaxID=3040156 RepID=A0AAV9GT42_9PEZI|nr:short chain dehydrogenase/ reductase [Podospora aff. communis PSN243]